MAEARHLFFSEPVRERLLEPLVVSAERRFAAKQLADGRLLASDLGGQSRAHVRESIEELLPRLSFVPLPLLVEGTYDVTPDHQAILGRVRDNVWVAAGFSGHGFMLAPAVGRILADAIVGGSRTKRCACSTPALRRGACPRPQIVSPVNECRLVAGAAAIAVSTRRLRPTAALRCPRPDAGV